MRESIHFVYDGIKSDDMGLINVNFDRGLLEEVFMPEREIKEVKIRGREKPYLIEVERKPLEFKVSFAFVDKYDSNRIRAVARWLNQDDYKEFYTTDNINRVYKCMVVSDSSLMHNGLKQGYVELTFRCDNPYTYSPKYVTPIYNISPSKYLEITNDGDVECYPKILIQKVGDGDVSIINHSDEEREFKFEGLLDGEELVIDCYNEDITTNLNGYYRYSSFNDNYLKFVYGVNRIDMVGNFKIQMEYRFRTLQG